MTENEPPTMQGQPNMTGLPERVLRKFSCRNGTIELVERPDGGKAKNFVQKNGSTIVESDWFQVANAWFDVLIEQEATQALAVLTAKVEGLMGEQVSKVWIIFQTVGYHEGVEAVCASEALAEHKLQELKNAKPAKFFYVEEFDVVS